MRIEDPTTSRACHRQHSRVLSDSNAPGLRGNMHIQVSQGTPKRGAASASQPNWEAHTAGNGTNQRSKNASGSLQLLSLLLRPSAKCWEWASIAWGSGLLPAQQTQNQAARGGIKKRSLGPMPSGQQKETPTRGSYTPQGQSNLALKRLRKAGPGPHPLLHFLGIPSLPGTPPRLKTVRSPAC